MERIWIMDIDTLPVEDPIEQRLEKIRNRILNREPRTQRNIEHNPLDISFSPDKYVKCGSSSANTPSQMNMKDFVDCVSTPSGSAKRVAQSNDTPKGSSKRIRVRRSLFEPSPSTVVHEPSRKIQKTTARPQRSHRDENVANLLHYGSEEDSEVDEDDDYEMPAVLSRTCRLLLDTPEDPAAGEETLIAQVPTTASSEVTSASRDADDSPHFPHDFLDFQWKVFPNLPIPPTDRREPFLGLNSGPTVSFTEPYELFTAIWDRQILEHIAVETNRYAQQLTTEMINQGKLYSGSRIAQWKDTSVDELYVFFAIILSMGVVIKSRLEEYWNADKDIFWTPGFSVHISLRRYQLLSRCLHFNNSDNIYHQNLDPSGAKLFKLQPIIDHLNNKFSNMYTMQQNIALDESLLQRKGWLDINQFIPNKAAAVGIKSYEICESQTGYLWRFKIHAHKPTSHEPQTDPFTSGTMAIVLNLVKGLEHTGYTLWMDNFYNSPALARKLKTLGFDCVGTLRTNRKFVPLELRSLTKSNMRQGQIVGCTSGDVDIIVWKDQNRVATISTYHGNSVSTANGITKPNVLVDYNICMGGVDKKDQVLAAYPIERKKTRIWYKKMFRRLLNVSVYNAFIIHKKTRQGTFSHRNFWKILICDILKKHSIPSTPMNTPTKTPKKGILKLAKDHYPGEYPFLKTTNSRNRQRHKCHVCSKRTVTYCVGCSKAVCVFKCFSSLHS